MFGLYIEDFDESQVFPTWCDMCGLLPLFVFCIKGNSFMFTMYDVFWCIYLIYICIFVRFFGLKHCVVGGMGYNIGVWWFGSGPRFFPTFLVIYVVFCHRILINFLAFFVIEDKFYINILFLCIICQECLVFCWFQVMVWLAFKVFPHISFIYVVFILWFWVSLSFLKLIGLKVAWKLKLWFTEEALWHHFLSKLT